MRDNQLAPELKAAATSAGLEIATCIVGETSSARDALAETYRTIILRHLKQEIKKWNQETLFPLDLPEKSDPH